MSPESESWFNYTFGYVPGSSYTGEILYPSVVIRYVPTRT